jgi:preprotein translocase subunit SecG
VETLQTLLFVLQVLVAMALIGFILIQHGKGADAGAAFGSGASATVFGASGSGNFMTRATTILALVFLANSLALAYLATQRTVEPVSLMQQQASAPVPEGPNPLPETGPEPPADPAPTDPGAGTPVIPAD